jgi:thiamine-phosphate diphosphorylase
VRLPRPIIGVVTDRRRLGGTGMSPLIAFATRAARAGATLLHIRERDLADGVLLSLVRQIAAEARGTAAVVVINDRADIALAGGAGGVHLRGDSPSASRVRGIVPPSFVVGRSVHSLDEAVTAEREGGADYLVFGMVYTSRSKPDARAAGLRELSNVCRRVGLPVLAIGGVTPERAAEVASAGAAGVCGIEMFVDADRRDSGPGGLTSLVESLRRAFDT